MSTSLLYHTWGIRDSTPYLACHRERRHDSQGEARGESRLWPRPDGLRHVDGEDVAARGDSRHHRYPNDICFDEGPAESR